MEGLAILIGGRALSDRTGGKENLGADRGRFIHLMVKREECEGRAWLKGLGVLV